MSTTKILGYDAPVAGIKDIAPVRHRYRENDAGLSAPN
jgi:hypothetical protein